MFAIVSHNKENKLVVIINILKYQKLRKLYCMKRNFLYQITAASKTPD